MQMLTPEAATSLVGSDLGASDWVLIDQDMVNRFADLTNDHQFIHVDPEAARQTPFGGTIVHGFFTLAMLASLQPSGAIVLQGIKMGVNYGFERIRFLQPVPVGSRIRARHILKSIDDKGGGRWLLTNEVTVEIEGGAKPAIVADWLGMQYV